MLWVLGLLWVLVVMVPTSFQHRSFLFLLLTGASVILGIGEAARTFGKDGSAFQQKPIGPPPIKDSPQGVSAPAPPPASAAAARPQAVGSFYIPVALNRGRKIERIVSKKLALFCFNIAVRKLPIKKPRIWEDATEDRGRTRPAFG
jgi:hypothetical protein